MSITQAMTGTDDTNNPTETGFGVSYAITCILSAILVVLKESSVAVHDGLTAILGHHWVTHGALNIILFLVLGFILSRSGMTMGNRALIKTMVGATVVGGLIIAGYFI